MEKRKIPCSGFRCVMNRDFDVSECTLTSDCQYYTPETDTSGIESVIDITMKQFCIEEKDRKKLEILFNAYVAQYMAVYCCL